MTDELKPCPFCDGGKPFISYEADSDGMGEFVSVKCGGCGAQSRQHFASNGNACPQFFAEVRESWNRRTTQPAPIPVQAQQEQQDHVVPPTRGTGSQQDAADSALCKHINALLALDADGALVPHGLGGHARELLTQASTRLRAIVEAGEQGKEDGRWLTDDQCVELRAKYPDIAGSFNVYEVTIHTELGCKVEEGEYRVFINRVIRGAIGQDDFDKVAEAVAEEIDTLALPAEGATSFVVYESGEREDVFWSKFYRIDRATLAKANDGEGA